jgi:hypothetical protein
MIRDEEGFTVLSLVGFLQGTSTQSVRKKVRRPFIPLAGKD